MMRENNTKRHITDILFIITLLGLFAVLSITVVLFGANAYKSNVETYDNNYKTRTSSVYVLQKIHSAENAKSVSVGSISNTDALIITSEDSGFMLDTYIYVYDGYLMELMELHDDVPSYENGQKIMELDSMQCTMYNDNLILVSFTTMQKDSESIFVRCDPSFL